MEQVDQAQWESKIFEFRDKFLARQLETPEELASLAELKAMAEWIAGSHSSLRDSLTVAEEPLVAGQYVRLNSAQEFGLELYWASAWAAKPPSWFADWLDKHPIYRAAFDVFKELLKDYEHMKMSKAEYDKLMQSARTPGLVGSDGTIYGLAKYEQLDEGWMIAALNYALNLIEGLPSFPDPAITKLPMSAKDGRSDPVLGIVGDWGGGAYQEVGAQGTVPSPAQRVLAALNQQKMDYLFHLGDTYYAGTGGSRLGKDSANEEQDNLVKLWPDQGEGRNFTLNSNHEMYAAGEGYFEVALGKSGLFKQQMGGSLFALSYPLSQPGKSWLVLGIDSAFFSDKENGTKMYMEGAIGSNRFLDEHKKQMRRIAQLCRGHSGPIMVMSHHNPCDTMTTKTNVLYDQVVKAIGRAPTLWIWGHVHNCIVYNQMIISADKPGPVISSITKSRCCGHGAVPFGPAWGLLDMDLPYVANTHDDAFPAGDPRVYNGFGMVTLHQDGGFTETYYEVRLPGQPAVEAWSRQWLGAELAAECEET